MTPPEGPPPNAPQGSSSEPTHPLAPLNFPLIALILLYRATLSPFLGRQCRFHPTCSQYALDACRTHHPLRAIALTTTRILRCNPLFKGGHDPCPPRKPANPHSPQSARSNTGS